MELSDRSKQSVVRWMWALFTIILVISILYIFFRSRGPLTPEFDLVIADVSDSAPLGEWAKFLADELHSQTKESGGIKDEEGRLVTVTFAGAEGYATILKERLRTNSKQQKVAVAVICKSTFTYNEMAELRAMSSFARANDIRISAVTNSPLVAARFLTSPRRTLIYPFVILLILVGGASGGSFYAFTQTSKDKPAYLLVFPITGHAINTGIVGNMAVGAGSGLVLVALAVKGFSLELEPLFKWPYDADGVRSIIQTLAVAIVGGYLGISLLDKLSEEVSKRIDNLTKKFEAQEKEFQVQKTEFEVQKKELDDQKSRLIAQHKDFATSFALGAKAHYSSALSDNHEDMPERFRKEVLQLAEKSNELKKNALATSLIAEIKRLAKDYKGSLAYYAEAIALLPDENLIHPENLYFNKACVRSKIGDPAQIEATYEDLRDYLKQPVASVVDIWDEKDLDWIKSQPDFEKNFPRPPAASTLPSPS